MDKQTIKQRHIRKIRVCCLGCQSEHQLCHFGAFQLSQSANLTVLYKVTLQTKDKVQMHQTVSLVGVSIEDAS